jgi:serine protease Do
MSRTAVTIFVLALACAPGRLRAADGPALPQALALEKAVQDAIERAEPSVACILVTRSEAYAKYPEFAPSTDGSGRLGKFELKLPARTGFREADVRQRKQIEALDLSLPDTVPESFGSGVVLDAAGFILTNAHVVRDATKIYVRLPGNRGSWADIHALDPRSDLAVLRLTDPVKGLKPIKFGDGDKVKKGQFVISLANPYAAGFRDGNPSASWGIVSNLKRRAPGNPNEVERSKQSIHEFGTLLQTDVRLTLGCSGGALLNLEGEVIGLTTATAALSGSETPGGYALPLDAGLKRVIDVLARGEEVEYGFLGVQMQQPGEGFPAALPTEKVNGVKIAGTPPGMPAQLAGLEPGDVIVAIDGKPVKDTDDLFINIGLALAGNKARVEVERRVGMRKTVEVELAKFYVPGSVIASKRPPARGGLRVDYTSTLTQRPAGPWGPQPILNGVVIREVFRDSPADKAGLQKDKIITHVNGHPVTTPKQYYDAAAKADKEIELTIRGFDGRQVDRVTIENKN